jgi:hypothetical protein
MLFLHDFVNHCSSFNHLHYVLFCCTFQWYRARNLIISSSLVVVTTINAAGPSCISTIAKELVIFDLVNKFFQQVVCSIRLTCSFRRSWNRESCSVTDSNSPRMRWGPLEAETDLRQDCLVLHFTSSLMMDWFEGKSCQWGCCIIQRKHSKTRLNFPYLLGIVTFVQLSPLLYQVWCCPKVFSLLNVGVWLYSDEQNLCSSKWHCLDFFHLLSTIFIHSRVILIL